MRPGGMCRDRFRETSETVQSLVRAGIGRVDGRDPLARREPVEVGDPCLHRPAHEARASSQVARLPGLGDEALHPADADLEEPVAAHQRPPWPRPDRVRSRGRCEAELRAPRPVGFSPASTSPQSRPSS